MMIWSELVGYKFVYTTIFKILTLLFKIKNDDNKTGI